MDLTEEEYRDGRITPASIGRRRSTTCVVQDEAGEELLAASFAHDEKGLRSLCRTLVRLKVELVAIERPDGLLVERLLGRRAAGPAAAPQPGRRRASALPGLGRQVRPVRRVRALRAGAHRPPPLPRARARQRPDQGAAGNDPRAGGRANARVALCSQLRAELERFSGPV